MVLGVLPVTSGTFSWFDRGTSDGLRKNIGALLEQPSFYPYLNAEQNLRLVADIKEIPDPDIDNVLDRAGILRWKKKPFGTFSTGMKQRLALASALLGGPDVLVLDEPTNGLDPEGIADVRAIISDYASEEKTVILASHLLAEVQKLCSHVAVLKEGEKIFDGTVTTILHKSDEIVIGTDDIDKLATFLENYSGASSFRIQDERVLLTLQPGYRISELTGHLITNGININHISESIGNLEQEFIKLLGGGQ